MWSLSSILSSRAPSPWASCFPLSLSFFFLFSLLFVFSYLFPLLSVLSFYHLSVCSLSSIPIPSFSHYNKMTIYTGCTIATSGCSICIYLSVLCTVWTPLSNTCSFQTKSAFRLSRFFLHVNTQWVDGAENIYIYPDATYKNIFTSGREQNWVRD